MERLHTSSVDKLLCYAARLGIAPKAEFEQTHKEVVEGELTMAGPAT